MKCTALTFALCAVAASSIKLAFTNNPDTVPGIESVWIVDQNGNFTFVVGQQKDQPSWSGAAVCDGIYYAVWGDPSTQGYGIASYDLTNKKVGTAWDTQSLFHQLICDPKNSKALLGSASDFSNAEVGDAPFHLKRFDTASQNETTIADFPSTFHWDGHDSIFSFSADGSELWTADTHGYKPRSSGGGVLYVMDTATGATKGTYTLKDDGVREKDTTFSHVFPTSGTTTTAVVKKGTGTDKVSFYTTQLTLAKGEAKLSKETPLDLGDGDSERTWVQCGGMQCTAVGQPAATSVDCFGTDGTKKLSIDLSGFPGTKTKPDLDGMACVSDE